MDEPRISLRSSLTVRLILINFAVFFVQVVVPGFTELFGLAPVAALSGAYWQFITYMFLHGGVEHIGLNMLVLLIFGFQAEHELTKRTFLSLYLVAGIGSALFHILLTGISSVLLIGASGAVFGILTAYAFLFPKNWIFIPPGLPVRGIYAVIALAVIEAFLGVFSLQRGIANFGHLGGIIAGVLAMLYLKYRYKKREEVREFEFFWE